MQQLGCAEDARAAKPKASTQEICARERLPLVTGSAALPSVQWRIVPDEPGRLAACGMTADLIIAPRPRADDPSSRSTFNTLLFATGRPVLMPIGGAPADDLFRQVTIAWKPTPQAARALVFAMPFLVRAAAVKVLTAEEKEHQSVDLDSVIAYLREHGAKAQRQCLSTSESGAAAAVLRAAQDASLLVMGAYGHSRIGEWIFGGFTRTMLQESPVPLLIAH